MELFKSQLYYLPIEQKIIINEEQSANVFNANFNKSKTN